MGMKSSLITIKGEVYELTRIADNHYETEITLTLVPFVGDPLTITVNAPAALKIAKHMIGLGMVETGLT